MEQQSLRAIIFDLDGVLTATVEYHFHAWSKALEPYKIPFNWHDNEKIRSLTRKQSLVTILNGQEISEEAQEEILSRKNGYYLEFIENISQNDILPGVWQLLKEIRSQNLPCAVASSSSNSRRVLQHLGLMDYFRVVVDANDISRSKPAPDVYLKAALDLAVSPGECLALDDSPAGIYSAARAGMCPVAIGSAACIPAAQVCLPDLSDVRLLSLQQIHSAWMARAYPPSTFTASGD